MSTAIPTLVTERLILRAPEAADFDAFAELAADPRLVHSGGPFDRAGAWGLFASAVASWHLYGFGSWIATTRGDSAFLGEIGFGQPENFPEPELGWTLTTAAEGHGYAFEGAQAARDWYWANTKAESVVSYVAIENTRSRSLAERLGAVLDPDAPFALGDTAEDTVVYRHWRPQ